MAKFLMYCTYLFLFNLTVIHSYQRDCREAQYLTNSNLIKIILSAIEIYLQGLICSVKKTYSLKKII